MLQITFLVLRNVLDRIAVTCPSNQCSSVNDKGTQGLESMLEAGKNVFARPDICRIVLWKVGELVDSLLVQFRVLDRVGIV
jgi:hypothetical protein